LKLIKFKKKIPRWCKLLIPKGGQNKKTMKVIVVAQEKTGRVRRRKKRKTRKVSTR